MMTPTPNTIRSSADRSLRSECSGSSVSRIDCSTVFVRNRLIRVLPRWPHTGETGPSLPRTAPGQSSPRLGIPPFGGFSDDAGGATVRDMGLAEAALRRVALAVSVLDDIDLTVGDAGDPARAAARPRPVASGPPRARHRRPGRRRR